MSRKRAADNLCCRVLRQTGGTRDVSGTAGLYGEPAKLQEEGPLCTLGS